MALVLWYATNQKGQAVSGTRCGEKLGEEERGYRLSVCIVILIYA